MCNPPCLNHTSNPGDTQTRKPNLGLRWVLGLLHPTGSVKFKRCWEVCQMIMFTPSHRLSQIQMMLRKLSNDTVLHLTGSVNFKWCWGVCQMTLFTPSHRMSQNQKALRSLSHETAVHLSHSNDAQKFNSWYCTPSHRIIWCQMTCEDSLAAHDFVLSSYQTQIQKNI